MNIETLNKLFKFSWAQAFSDCNGKSSAPNIAYFVVTLVGCLGFLYSLWVKSGELTMWSVTVITLGVGAYTGKKIVDGKVKPLGVTEESTTTNKQTIAQVTTLTEETTKEELK